VVVYFLEEGGKKEREKKKRGREGSKGSYALHFSIF